MQPYVTAFAKPLCFSISSQTCNTFSIFPACPYVFTRMPKVTGEGVICKSRMRCMIDSKRARSFNLQHVSKSAFRSTSSTSLGCISMNFSTNEIARYTRVEFKRLRLSPTVFINMRETVYLSVVPPVLCMSSNAFQASSTPRRRINSSKVPEFPPFGPRSLPRPPRDGVGTFCNNAAMFASPPSGCKTPLFCSSTTFCWTSESIATPAKSTVAIVLRRLCE
mmetsp:Transcript_110940/g.174945  ORF Transcript_110940/g.174945 Transcript_110940/m.174945 type:complete len:221 (+) Transcript_110940:1507-2169(+)